MKKLTEDLKRALRALASADAGELMSGTDKTLFLRNAQLDPAQTPLAPAPVLAAPRREIVLTLGQSLPAAVMDYTIGACRRLHADLSVACADAQTALHLLAPYEDALRKAGISCATRIFSGDFHQGLADYVRANPRVMFAVAAGEEELVGQQTQGAMGYMRAAQWLLPLVVVAGNGASSEFIGEYGA